MNLQASIIPIDSWHVRFAPKADISVGGIGTQPAGGNYALAEGCRGFVRLAIIMDGDLRHLAQVNVIPFRRGIIIVIDNLHVPETLLGIALEGDFDIIAIFRISSPSTSSSQSELLAGET